MSYRNYHPANGFHVSIDGNGDFKTITAASNACINAGLTNVSIFIHDGIYTENPPLAPGCDYIAFVGDQSEPNVTINGKCTFSSDGTVSLNGIRLQTNLDFALSVTGSAASVINLNSCFLNCTNNTGINFASSSGNASISLYNCNGDTAFAGAAYWTSSSAGTLNLYNFVASNSGSSTNASNNSAGAVFIRNCYMLGVVSTTATGAINVDGSNIAAGTSGSLNTVCLLNNGNNPSSIATGSSFTSGTAASISIGTGATLTMEGCTVSSSAANAITGLGTLKYGPITFIGTTTTINPTTQTQLITRPTYSTVNQVFTGNGTYTPTKGMVYVHITALGGGAGGGGAATTGASQYSLGGGGGAGEYAFGIFSAATIGSSQSVTVGALGGGGSGTTGSNGGNTSVGSLISANGGTGGGSGAAGGTSSGTAGAGGTGGSGGDVRTPGAYGGSGLGVFASTFAYSGVGGTSQLGQGATNILLASGAGVNAAGFGSGGSGAMNLASQASTKTGGNGTAGIVVIQEYILS